MAQAGAQRPANKALEAVERAQRLRFAPRKAISRRRGCLISVSLTFELGRTVPLDLEVELKSDLRGWFATTDAPVVQRGLVQDDEDVFRRDAQGSEPTDD